MPKTKQPVPLQELAFDALVEHSVRYCDSISRKGCLSELRRSVDVIKHYLSEFMPRFLFSDYCKKFLHQFHSLGLRGPWSKDRPISHQRAALEIMMDVPMDGLTCGDYSLRYLDPLDAHRIRGLVILEREADLDEYTPMGLEHYRLENLTTFTYPTNCSDHELEIIGQRCSKLEIVNIYESSEVSDRGLRALRPCSELRFIDLRDCGVTRDGVNDFLSSHKKLEEFEFGDYETHDDNIFDVLSRPISMVCPSIKRFMVKCDTAYDPYLQSLVTLFPNLTYLGFRCPGAGDLGDLCVLKNLKNLRELDFFHGDFSLANVKELLISVGRNITRLTLKWMYVSVAESDLNFIRETCPNLEWLDFSYKPIRRNEKLAIPTFPKLKYLACCADIFCNEFRAELVFGEMLSLEILEVIKFDAVYEMFELMVVDNVRFPNLREVRTGHQFLKNHIRNRITQIAENKNLDFSFLCFFKRGKGESLIWHL